MRALREAGIACLICGTALAQSFEAADVHLGSEHSGGMRAGFLPGGRYQVKNATLLDLIGVAWGVETERVAGGPGWLAEDRFEIVAKAPPDSTDADRRLMLRALLVERFGLALRDDHKTLPVFALVPGKRGSQLKRPGGAGEAGCEDSAENGPPPMISYACHNMTMERFAASLREVDRSVTRIVVDRTGLTGPWDFTIRFTPLFEYQKAAAAGDPSPGVAFFEALEKAGLRLEPRMEPLSVLAVDRVNRAPTPNAPDVAKILPAPPAEFEVAEVKPSRPGSPQRGTVRPGGQVDLGGYTLKDLIEMGWDLDDDRIVDGPKWLDSDRFDVVAKAPAGTSPEQLTVMMKALVIERFHLAAHMAEKPVPVYLLTAGKNPKLKEADPANRPGCGISRGQLGNGTAAMPLKVYTCQNMTMAKFAELIRPQAAGYIRNPVVDQTGLKGAWDFTLSWTRNDVMTAAQKRKSEDGAAGDPTGGITVFEAIEKQLGLKLEGGKKYPLPALVVDRAERPE